MRSNSATLVECNVRSMIYRESESTLFPLLLSCRQRRMRRRRGATRFVIYHAPRSTPPPQKQTRKGTERSFRRAEIRNGGFSQPIYSAGRLERMLNRKWRETKQQPSTARSIRPSNQLLLSFTQFPVIVGINDFTTYLAPT